MYGPVDGEICGVVVMNHPDNFRFPQWVRLHPAMPYFVYAPMVQEPFAIEPGKPYVSKFRYLHTTEPRSRCNRGFLERMDKELSSFILRNQTSDPLQSFCLEEGKLLQN